jgi:hypothetical protein
MEKKSSTDIWFCAFLKIKGIKLVSYEVVGRGKVKCEYVLSAEEWQTLRIEFNNSICSEFKTAVESIKDLSF